MQEEDFQDFQLYIVCFNFNHNTKQEGLSSQRPNRQLANILFGEGVPMW